jgi:hypothetical protein
MRYLRWIVPVLLILGLAGGIVGAKVLSIKAAAQTVQDDALGGKHACPPGYDGCASGDPCPKCEARSSCPMAKKDGEATPEAAADTELHEGCPLTDKGPGHGKGEGKGAGQCERTRARGAQEAT